MYKNMESFEKRLVELSNIKDGWLDGECKAATPEAIEATRRLFKALYAADPKIQLPFIGPDITEENEGGVELEWISGEPGGPVEVYGVVSACGVKMSVTGFSMVDDEEDTTLSISNLDKPRSQAVLKALLTVYFMLA